MTCESVGHGGVWLQSFKETKRARGAENDESVAFGERASGQQELELHFELAERVAVDERVEGGHLRRICPCENPAQTPKATGQGGDEVIGQSGSAIVFGW